MSNDSMEKPVGLRVVNNEDGETIISGTYGKELAIDCYECDTGKFNRTNLRIFFKGLVKLLNMKAGDLHFWDDVGVPKAQRQTRPETKGTTAIQFILTSNITVHALDILERVYVNIFSCKNFETGLVQSYVCQFFNAKRVRTHVIWRN